MRTNMFVATTSSRSCSTCSNTATHRRDTTQTMGGLSTAHAGASGSDTLCHAHDARAHGDVQDCSTTRTRRGEYRGTPHANLSQQQVCSVYVPSSGPNLHRPLGYALRISPAPASSTRPPSSHRAHSAWKFSKHTTNTQTMAGACHANQPSKWC